MDPPRSDGLRRPATLAQSIRTARCVSTLVVWIYLGVAALASIGAGGFLYRRGEAKRRWWLAGPIIVFGSAGWITGPLFPGFQLANLAYDVAVLRDATLMFGLMATVGALAACVPAVALCSRDGHRPACLLAFQTTFVAEAVAFAAISAVHPLFVIPTILLVAGAAALPWIFQKAERVVRRIDESAAWRAGVASAILIIVPASLTRSVLQVWKPGPALASALLARSGIGVVAVFVAWLGICITLWPAGPDRAVTVAVAVGAVVVALAVVSLYLPLLLSRPIAAVACTLITLIGILFLFSGTVVAAFRFPGAPG